MPFTPSTYTAGGTQTYLQANNAETQYSEATLSLEQDQYTPFVFDGGLVATKDGTTASQLDVTAGVAFLRQTDSTLRRRAVGSSTQSTVGHATATLYLDLNSDGTWSFATTHSADANHLTIATVTTDASANIASVTDTRTLNTTLLSGMAGLLNLPSLKGVRAHPLASSGSDDALALYDRNAVAGAAIGWAQSGGGLYAWDSVNSGYIFQGGTKAGIQFNGTAAFQALSATYDAVKLVSKDTTYYTSAGVGDASYGAGAGAYLYDNKGGGYIYSAATKAGITFGGNISGPIGGGIPTTRNGAALSVPIYTGTTTPVSPPTGSVWVKA